MLRIKLRKCLSRTEYQHGHYFMDIVEWLEITDTENIYKELEIYSIRSQPIWTTIDVGDFEKVKELFFYNPVLFEKVAGTDKLPMLDKGK